MQLKWGSTPFDAASCEITTTRRLLFTKANQPYAWEDTARVRGYLTADGQAALTQAQSALMTALAVPYQDLVLYQDGGTASATALRNASSISGVTIVDGPHFPEGGGAEYATMRRFEFTARGEYRVSGAALLYLDWQETVSLSGGDPLYVCLSAINGPPQRQLIYPQTPFTATQSGFAVGVASYPIAPVAIWPFAQMRAPRFERVSPQRKGRGFEGYTTRWTYEFESPATLVGVPNLWPG